MTTELRFWRSIHGSGPYEANPMQAPWWVLAITPHHRARDYGIFDSELEAVERAIRDNQRLAREIKAAIAALKGRRAALKATNDVSGICSAAHGMVGDTDTGYHGEPRCSDNAGHPGAHSSDSGHAWLETDGRVWRVATDAASSAPVVRSLQTKGQPPGSPS